MKFAPTLLTCLLVCAAPAAAADSVQCVETRAETPAAPASPAWALSQDELAELEAAEQQATELEHLSGGAITNDDLLTILLIVGIVVLVAIIV